MLEEYVMIRKLLKRLNGKESSLNFKKAFNDDILEVEFAFPFEINCNSNLGLRRQNPTIMSLVMNQHVLDQHFYVCGNKRQRW